jgi:hypothetical protein
MLCNNPQQRRPQPNGSASLKSYKLFSYVQYVYIWNMYRCTVSNVGVVRLLYGQPRNSRSIAYKDKKLIHRRKGTSRLWRTNTLFSMIILGFLFENKSAGAWSCWLSLPPSLRMFGAILQIPYIILWLSQGTFYLNFPVLIHHLWWLRSGKLGRLEFVFGEY